MLSSVQNPLVKQFRKLHRTKERHKQGLFLLEGTHLFEEACAVGWPLVAVCCTHAWQERHPVLWQQAQSLHLRVEDVSDEVMAAIATTVNPDGIVAIAHRHSSTSSILDVTKTAQKSPFQLGVALETLQDPGNLGTIIRTAAAGGVDRLWVSADSVDLDHPKVLRASAGQWFRLPMTMSAEMVTEIQAMKSAGVQVIATLPSAERIYWEADLSRPTLILAGNEGAGLSTEWIAASDMHVRIPLAPHVESLNVAIAVSLLIYEANRQRGVVQNWV